MQHSKQWMMVVLLIAALSLSACASEVQSAASEKPALVESVEGTEYNRVTLTEKAAERLGVQTAPVREEQVNGEPRLVIPYSALIYGLHGETWVYVSPEPLTFVRQPVTVDYIEGDMVILLDGPPVGTEVATVAVAELYGTDTGVGK